MATLNSDKNGTDLGSSQVENERLLTELREANSRLQSEVDQLKLERSRIVQQERMNAMAQMASRITHDFNNHLSPVIGFAELILEHPECMDDRRRMSRYVEAIRKAARDMVTITERLRRFYRLRSRNEALHQMNIVEIAREVLQETESAFTGGTPSKSRAIGIEAEFKEVPAFLGNDAEIREAIGNVLLNAVDAMPEGGTLRVRTEADGEWITLSVLDTGIGMSSEAVSRCFDPFFTTKKKQGAGLGLAVTCGIVRRHAGLIGVESKSGKGTVVTIRLPVGSNRIAGSGGRSMLVVEDNQGVIELVRAALESVGIAIDVATTCAEALNKLENEDFALAVLDVYLPDGTGLDLAREIKSSNPDIPVVIMTGNPDSENVQESVALDVDAYWIKPLDVNVLIESVRGFLGIPLPVMEGHCDHES